MRILSKLLAYAILAPIASAQLVAVSFKDPKDAAKFKNYLTEFRGKQVVVGEAYRNLAVDVEHQEFTPGTNKPIELLVADPGDPSKVPYKFDGNTKVVTIKKQLVSIPEIQIKNYEFFDIANNLVGLAADYASNKKLIDELTAERDAKTKGSPDWMAAHRRVVGAMDRLHSWLESSLFPEAAEKLVQELGRQRKLVDQAAAARANAAKASVKDVATPEALVALAKTVSNGADTFKVQESLHARIIYRSTFEDARVHALLEFVEDAIEAFRVEFVDPYLDPTTFPDYIPERVFIEWWFGPDDVSRHERYLVDYFKLDWGPRKAERLQLAGHPVQRNEAPEFLDYWKAADDADLEGTVAHDLGHHLAHVHYDQMRSKMSQEWLGEAVGYYVSFEWLGRNTVTCKAFAKPSEYAQQQKKEAEKSADIGLRDWYNALALESGPTIDRLVLKTLFEMGDADLAKSWSFFDFVVRRCGKQGQQFLRAACNSARTKNFIGEWRNQSQKIFELQGQDVFANVEKRWREFAQAGQETGDVKRPR